MHTTNYVNTLITVATGTKSVAATEPPTGKGSISELQFEMLHGHERSINSNRLRYA